MTSHDVRDMLDLPSDAARPAKKLKVAASRPTLKGLAREIQNLSGDNPIAIVPEVTVFKKKKKFASRKPAARWDLRPFRNSARGQDNLILRHWRRKEEPAAASAAETVEGKAEADAEDSTFAKYNVQVNVPRYEVDQYNEKLSNPDWTKEETDYLMDLAQDFDLRWPVIWDRYEYTASAQGEGEASDLSIVPISKERSMEDLKARYYFVAAKMMAVNTPLERMKEAEFRLHELMLQYNAASETARKTFAENFMKRSRDETREEESLLLELKRILARSETLNEERRELYARLEAPATTSNIGIYTSSQGLQQLLQQLMSIDKSKKRKSLMGAEGVSPAAGASNMNQPSNFERRDSTVRESISGPSVTNNNKKGPNQGTGQRRQLTEEEERVYGVSHHERLASGPAYRHEKISKPITSKSSIQQQKINNVLTELEIPPRLIMPTAEVGELFEGLLGSIHNLLEARKVSDKLTGEINVIKAHKAEKEAKERGGADSGGLTVAGQAQGAAAATVTTTGDVKMEDREPSAAPSVSAESVHKRSASVLSTVSDRSSKRQKK